MSKKTVYGFLYVSLFVMIWGTLGSFVDYIFLNNEIYIQGSLGQLSTFSVFGVLTVILATNLYPRISSLNLVLSTFGDKEK